jgi:hypothetical protein
MMEKIGRRTAVGAGTSAGDADDEERAPESRAAEAEVDEMLESLRTTGAEPTGVGGVQSDRPAAMGHQDKPTGELDAAPEDRARPPGPLRPEGPREDLKHNAAGVASRVESKK